MITACCKKFQKNFFALRISNTIRQKRKGFLELEFQTHVTFFIEHFILPCMIILCKLCPFLTKSAVLKSATTCVLPINHNILRAESCAIDSQTESVFALNKKTESEFEISVFI